MFQEIYENKKVIIQLNLTSGLGDILSDFLACISSAKYLKTLGYYVIFKYALHNHFYPEGPNILEKVFHHSMFSVFDTTEEINNCINSMNIDDMIFFNQNYPESRPGVHHIDFYFNNLPKSFKGYSYSAQNVIFNKNRYDAEISFTEDVENKIKNFRKIIPQEYVFLHIRRHSIENFDFVNKNIKSFINKNYNNIPIHIGSHQETIINSFKKENNIYTYPFTNKYTHLSNNLQVNNFIETFTEMASIRNAKKILAYNEYGYTSNFLHYALLQKVDYERIDINNWF